MAEAKPTPEAPSAPPPQGGAPQPLRRAKIQVVVMYSPSPRQVNEWQVRLPAGSTVLQALRASAVQKEFPDLDLGAAVVGIWGHKARLQQPLRDGDRVEIYRPLKVDPKVARRERFRKQGVRAAGLFARK